MSEIAEKVKMIVKDKLNIDDDSKITEDATFVNDLGADSLDTVELIMELENTFGIEIPEDQSEKIKTVGDAIAYIEEAQK
ncbi:MAG: acyl carrier protein [Muribaculaceae bacterium]|nr:acyl carrier protein [Bacteroidales bacterium]MDE6041572.1 acyl carrier protein [Muribaculaceae bacterium]